MAVSLSSSILYDAKRLSARDLLWQVIASKSALEMFRLSSSSSIPAQVIPFLPSFMLFTFICMSHLQAHTHTQGPPLSRNSVCVHAILIASCKGDVISPIAQMRKLRLK